MSFDRATLWVKRLKGSNSGTHPIEGDELRAIRRYLNLRQDNLPWLFLSERQGRLTRFAVNYLVDRTAEAAGFTNLHPHCLRHSCGYALADRGVDLTWPRCNNQIEFVIPTHLGAVNYGNNIGPDWSTGTGGIGGCTFGTLVVASDFPFNKMVAQTSGDNSGITHGWWITTFYIVGQALQRSKKLVSASHLEL